MFGKRIADGKHDPSKEPKPDQRGQRPRRCSHDAGAYDREVNNQRLAEAREADPNRLRAQVRGLLGDQKHPAEISAMLQVDPGEIQRIVADLSADEPKPRKRSKEDGKLQAIEAAKRVAKLYQDKNRSLPSNVREVLRKAGSA